MAFHVDPEKCTQLNLRRAPAPAGEIIVTLPQGTAIEKLREHATKPHWWEVLAHLNGQQVRGYLNSEYLKDGEGATINLSIASSIPSCHLRRNSHRRRDDFGRANPLDDENMPNGRSGSASQKKDALVTISKYLDTEFASHKRLARRIAISMHTIIVR